MMEREGCFQSTPINFLNGQHRLSDHEQPPGIADQLMQWLSGQELVKLLTEQREN